MIVDINRTWTYQKTVAQFVITSRLHMELVQVIHSNRFTAMHLLDFVGKYFSMQYYTL